MIIADTGFWLALANRRDRHHARAVEALAEIEEGLVSTWPVMTETCHLLAARLGVDAELAFLRSFEAGSFVVFPLTLEHAPRIRALMEKYRDLPMDLADASLVILAEDLGDGRILSTDRRDFDAYLFKNREPFCNLLLP
ncbi:MAG: PIN domain-containing protein [bacterium]